MKANNRGQSPQRQTGQNSSSATASLRMADAAAAARGSVNVGRTSHHQNTVHQQRAPSNNNQRVSQHRARSSVERTTINKASITKTTTAAQGGQSSNGQFVRKVYKRDGLGSGSATSGPYAQAKQTSSSARPSSGKQQMQQSYSETGRHEERKVAASSRSSQQRRAAPETNNARLGSKRRGGDTQSAATASINEKNLVINENGAGQQKAPSSFNHQQQQMSSISSSTAKQDCAKQLPEQNYFQSTQESVHQRSTNRSSNNGDNNQTHTIQLRQGGPASGGMMATSQSGMTLSPTNQSFRSISLANQQAPVPNSKPPTHKQQHQAAHEKSIDAQELAVHNASSAQPSQLSLSHQKQSAALHQQYQSVMQLECTPSSGQGISQIVVSDSHQDPRAMTAHKSNRIQQHNIATEGAPLQDDNSDAKSEQLQSITLEEQPQKAEAACSTAANNGRRSNARHRVRRQDVRFMKRGAVRQLPDNKSELPLQVAAADGGWQRFQTVEQRSEQMNSICQSVSISRTSGFMTNSEMGDSLSNVSLDDDDETTSQVRESLKRELKLIQVAKKDLKVKRRSVAPASSQGGASHAKSSHTIMHQQNEELYEEMSSVKQNLFEKNCRIQFLEKQSLRDKAELDAKDKLIEKEVNRAELLQSQLQEAQEKQVLHEELLEAKASEVQTLSMFVSKMLKEHFLDYESHTVTQPPLQQKLEILDRHLGKVSSKAKTGNPAQKTTQQHSLQTTLSEKRRSPPQQHRPSSQSKPHTHQNNTAKTQLERTPTQSTNSSKPPTKSDKAGYISQTSRGVSKQIAQALEMDNLGKMDAVDILSVLKRIENLEKMAQAKAQTKKHQQQQARAVLQATSGSGSGGSVPKSATDQDAAMTTMQSNGSQSHQSQQQQQAAIQASLKQKHAKLAKMLNNSKLI